MVVAVLVELLLVSNNHPALTELVVFALFSTGKEARALARYLLDLPYKIKLS
jgi:hypothetical protein